MPHYFFDIKNQQGFHRDDIGLALDNIKDACDQVHILLPDIARDQIMNEHKITIICHVRDETGKNVYWGELNWRGATP